MLLSWSEVVSAAGAARQLGAGWLALAPRKLLAAARPAPPHAFLAVYHALQARNDRARGSPHFLKGNRGWY